MADAYAIVEAAAGALAVLSVVPLATVRRERVCFEIARVVRYDAYEDLLTLDMWSATYSRYYLLTWRHSDGDLVRVQHCVDSDPDCLLTEEPLDSSEVHELTRWLEAEDGRGSAAWHRARLLDEALRIHDPR